MAQYYYIPQLPPSVSVYMGSYAVAIEAYIQRHGTEKLVVYDESEFIEEMRIKGHRYWAFRFPNYRRDISFIAFPVEVIWRFNSENGVSGVLDTIESIDKIRSGDGNLV